MEIVVVEDVGSGSDTVVDVEAGVNVGPAEGRNTGAASRSEGQRVHADSAEASGGKGAEGQGEEDEDEDVGKVPGVTPSGKRSREDDDDHDDLGGDDELDAKQKRVLRTSARPIRDRVIDAGSNGSISISPHRRLPQDTHQRYQRKYFPGHHFLHAHALFYSRHGQFRNGLLTLCSIGFAELNPTSHTRT